MASQSATSVAKVKPIGAWRRNSSTCTFMVATMPVIAGNTSSKVSTLSNTQCLSSLKSRLYDSGNDLSVDISPVRLPIKRPALPRASSAMSGFFFCGMIELPVA